MKNIPKVGFICTGADALELSGAICCCGKLIRLMKSAGYITGGCYSCISPDKNVDSLRQKLKYMCACSDVVITIGCEGFRETDVIPDVTSSLCDREASFFTYWLSAGDTDVRPDCSFRPDEPDFLYPSRAVAAFCRGALILNLPSDSPIALKRLTAILPSVNFAVNKNGKSAGESAAIENLILNYYSEKSF